MKRARSERGRWAGPAVSIVVEEPLWQAHAGVVAAVRRAARLALKTSSTGEHHAVTILLAGDKRLRELNETFRNRRKTTNVLSFPAVPKSWPYRGDVALGYGVSCKQALAQNKSLSEHAAHLTIHGILHLLGYDHEVPEDAAKMENLEISLLARMGIRDPYAPVPVRRQAKRHKLASCLTLLAR